MYSVQCTMTPVLTRVDYVRNVHNRILFDLYREYQTPQLLLSSYCYHIGTQPFDIVYDNMRAHTHTYIQARTHIHTHTYT